MFDVLAEMDHVTDQETEKLCGNIEVGLGKCTILWVALL